MYKKGARRETSSEKKKFEKKSSKDSLFMVNISLSPKNMMYFYT